MDKSLTLGIDSGTSSCKVLVLAPDGVVAAEASAPHEVRYPQPGHAEQDPDAWWLAIRTAVAQIDRGVRSRVRAVAVTSQREGLVLVDRRGRPLGPCMIWLDRRAAAGMEELLASVTEEELFAITGLRADPTFSLARILWMRQVRLDALARATCLLQPADYLAYRLTGALVSDLSMASRTCLLDIRSRSWSTDLLERFAIDRGLLPELVEPGTPLGRISASAAVELDLPDSVEVVAGAGDQHAMAVSGGAYRPGVLAASVGTSTSVVAVIDHVLLDPHRRVLTNCAAVPGGWDLQAPIWTTGGAIEWLARLAGGHRMPEAILDLAFASEAGARGVIALPHLIGAGSPWWSPDARAGILNLGPGHGLEDIARAFVEVIGMEIRINVELLGQLTVTPPSVLALNGGMLADERVAALFASIIGLPLVTHDHGSAAAHGVAAVAAVATGSASTLDEVLAHHPGRRHEPDPELADYYSELRARRPVAVRNALDALQRTIGSPGEQFAEVPADLLNG